MVNQISSSGAMCLKMQISGSLAAVGINNISKELHPNNGKGVVEDD